MTDTDTTQRLAAGDLKRLRELAESAEDDGWYNAPFLRAFIDEDDAPVFSEADAAFIAAADPSTVRALLDRIAVLERVREAAERLLRDNAIGRDDCPANSGCSVASLRSALRAARGDTDA